MAAETATGAMTRRSAPVLAAPSAKSSPLPSTGPLFQRNALPAAGREQEKRKHILKSES